jgi:tetratricopeptide (TPR) repeat protein
VHPRNTRFTRAALALLIAAAAPLVAPEPAHAQDDEWGVGGSEERTKEIIRRYKQLLERNPDEGLAFRKLVEYAGKGAGLDRLIAEYEKKVERDPDRLAYHLILGHLLKAKERHEDAVAAYSKAIEVDPDDPRAYLGRGQARFMLQQNAESTADFEVALSKERSKDKKQQILRKLADLAFAQRDWEAAQKYYRQLIDLDPRNEFQRMEYAAVLVKYKRYDAALEQYEALVKLAGRDVKARATTLRDMGDLYEKMGDDEAALDTYGKAMRYVRPGNWLYRELQQRIIGVYRRGDRLGEYVATYSKKWRRPNYDQTMILASLYDELGDEENALKFYKLAVRKSSRSVDPRVKVIQILQRRGDLKAVVKAYESLIRISPGQARYQFDLAKIHFRNGDKKRAIALLKKIRSRFRRDPDVLVTLADTYSRFGMRDEALDVYKALVRAEPRNDSFIASLGEYHYQAGDTTKAVETWERILKSDLPKAQAHARLGEVFIQHNMIDKGVRHLETAAKLDPDDIDITRSLANAYENARRWSDAVATWERLMDDAPQPTTVAEARGRIIGIYDRSSRLRQKIREFREAFEADPPDLRAGYFLAEGYAKLGEPEKAERVYRAIVDADGEVTAADIDALVALEKVYSNEGRNTEAIDVLRKLAELRPLRAKEYYHRIAELSLLAYEDDQAVRFAKLALEKNPDDANAHARLADVYAKMRRVEDAIKQYRVAIDLDPRSFPNHLALAALLVERDQPDEARQLYMTVAKKAFDDAVILEAARAALALSSDAASLERLELELSPFVFRSPPKPVYRKVMLEIYGRMIRPLVAARDHGTSMTAADADRLRRLGGRAFPVLLDALSSDDVGQRQIALSMLSQLRMGAAALAIGRMVDDETEPLRLEAAVAAALIGDDRAATPVTRALSSANPTIRDLATWTLGGAGSKKAVSTLAEVIESGQSATQIALAALSIGRIGDASGFAPLEALLESAAMRRYNDNVSVNATWALGLLQDARAVPRLTDVLERSSGPAADVAAWSLGRVGGPLALGVLLDAYWSGDAELRERAHRGLVHFAQRDAIPTAEITQDALTLEARMIDPRRRVINTEQISSSRVRVARRMPLTALDPILSAHPDALVAAAKRAHDANDPDALRELVRDLAHPSLRLGADATISDDATAARARAVRALAPTLRKLAGDGAMSAHALASLGLLGDPADLALFAAAFSDDDPSRRVSALLATARLPDSAERAALITRGLGDPALAVRAAAAQLAGASGDASLTDALRGALSDPSDVVRANAAAALARRGDAGATDGLAALAGSGALAPRLAALRALHALGADDVLSAYADHPDPRVRLAARGL